MGQEHIIGKDKLLYRAIKADKISSIIFYGPPGTGKTTLEKVIADNPQAVADYRGGKEKALGALVGQTMKAMKGKANPGMVNKMLREMLG